jgi:hypothetical protein
MFDLKIEIPGFTKETTMGQIDEQEDRQLKGLQLYQRMLEVDRAARRNDPSGPVQSITQRENSYEGAMNRTWVKVHLPPGIHNHAGAWLATDVVAYGELPDDQPHRMSDSKELVGLSSDGTLLPPILECLPPEQQRFILGLIDNHVTAIEAEVASTNQPTT